LRLTERACQAILASVPVVAFGPMESAERIAARNNARVRIGVGLVGIPTALLLGVLLLLLTGFGQSSVGSFAFWLVLVGVLSCRS